MSAVLRPDFVQGGCLVNAALGTFAWNTGVIKSITRTGVGVYEIETDAVSILENKWNPTPMVASANALAVNIEYVSETLTRVRTSSDNALFDIDFELTIERVQTVLPGAVNNFSPSPPPAPIPPGALSGWIDVLTVVQLQTITDTVVIGDTVMAGAEKFRVVGDTRLEGALVQVLGEVNLAANAASQISTSAGDLDFSSAADISATAAVDLSLTATAGDLALLANVDASFIATTGDVTITAGVDLDITATAGVLTLTGAAANTLEFDAAGGITASPMGGQPFTVDNANLVVVGAVRAQAGNAGTPTHSFELDTDTGMFSSAADVIGWSTGGVETMKLSSTALVSTVQISNAVGSAAAPAYSFTGDLDTGIYHEAANTIGLSTGGTLRWSINTTAVVNTLQVSSAVGSQAAPTYSFTGDLDTGMFQNGADVIGLSTGGTLRWSISTTTLVNTLQVSSALGNAGAPTYSFTGDLDTGMFSSGANTLDFAVQGNARFQVVNTAVIANVPFAASVGAVGAPTHTFASDLDTGMFQGGANNLVLTAGGSEKFRCTATQISFFAAAVVVQQTVGAVTNNVAAGGVDGTIANYTDLAVYANDSNAIRNDIYQLARSVGQLTTAMRNYGLGV